jgi:hypothetical protein
MYRFRWLVVAALALALTGCIKLDQTLTLEKDGSGTLDVRYGMSEQAIAQLEMMEQMSQSMGEGDGAGIEMDADTPFDFDFDEAQVREDFASQNLEGVELLSASSETVDGWRYMELKIKFDSLDALMKTEFFEDSEMSLAKDAEGNYVLSQRSGDGDDAAGASAGDEEMQAQMLEQMSAMFAGMHIANRIVVPSEIVETNATEVDGRTAAWVYDIDEDPSVMTKLENLSMRVVFSSDGVSMPEL